MKSSKLLLIDNKNDIITNINKYNKNIGCNEKYLTVTIVLGVILLTMRTMVIVITVIHLILRAVTVVVTLLKVNLKPH
jgi:hypothetical protein